MISKKQSGGRFTRSSTSYLSAFLRQNTSCNSSGMIFNRYITRGLDMQAGALYRSRPLFINHRCSRPARLVASSLGPKTGYGESTNTRQLTFFSFLLQKQQVMYVSDIEGIHRMIACSSRELLVKIISVALGSSATRGPSA